MDSLAIVIRPTPQMVRVNGAPCRVWAGTLPSGVVVDVFVRGLGTSNPDAKRELDMASVDHGGMLWSAPVCIAPPVDDGEHGSNGVP